jgi:hypothetical protein
MITFHAIKMIVIIRSMLRTGLEYSQYTLM